MQPRGSARSVHSFKKKKKKKGSLEIEPASSAQWVDDIPVDRQIKLM